MLQIRRILLFLSLIWAVAPSALAHGEFVRTDIKLQPSGKLELYMSGQSSNLPILQAEIQAQLFLETPAMKKLEGPGRDFDFTTLLPENRLQYVVLKDLGSGNYLGTFPKALPKGDLILLLVDTTFKAESANVATAITVKEAPLEVGMILPKTNTPPSAVIYGLLGLLIPLGLIGAVMGIAWLDKRGKVNT
jgi:hypothetical protein